MNERRDESEVPPAECSRLVDAGAVVIDVRTEREWMVGQVDGSTWIPMDEIESRRDEIPTDCAIVVVCRSGARSGRVAEVLRSWGHDAVNLAGGLQAWDEEGLPFDGTVA